MTRSIGTSTRPAAGGSKPTCTCRPRRASERMPVRHASGDPSASMLTAAPPPDQADHGSDDALGADRRVHDLVGAVEQRPVQRRSRHVDRAHPGTQAAGDGDRGQPDPTRPDDDDALPAGHARPRDDRPVCRGDAAAEPGRPALVEALRQRDEVRRGRVDDDELRERPRVGEAGLTLPRADLAVARQAHRALAARHDERSRDAAPQPRGIHPLADGLDDPGELVTGHVRERRDVAVVPHPAVPVAAAQPARDDPHDGPTRWRDGVGDLGHLEGGAERGVRQGSHAPSLPPGGRMPCPARRRPPPGADPGLQPRRCGCDGHGWDTRWSSAGRRPRDVAERSRGGWERSHAQRQRVLDPAVPSRPAWRPCRSRPGTRRRHGGQAGTHDR